MAASGARIRIGAGGDTRSDPDFVALGTES
jgi:hypothetical protein